MTCFKWAFFPFYGKGRSIDMDAMMGSKEAASPTYSEWEAGE